MNCFPKNHHIFFDKLKRFFSLNKCFCFVLIVVFMIGFFTGIFCTLKHNSCLTLFDLPSFFVRKLFCKEISFIVYFLLKSICLSLFLFVLYLTTCVRIGWLITFGVLIYLSYVFGIDCTILIVNVGTLKGFVLVVFSYFPWQLLQIFLISVFCFKFLNLNNQMFVYGNCYIQNYRLNIFLTMIFLLIIIVLIQTVLFWFLIKFFVFI